MGLRGPVRLWRRNGLVGGVRFIFSFDAVRGGGLVVGAVDFLW